MVVRFLGTKEVESPILSDGSEDRRYMDTIHVTRPGKYKKVKTYDAGLCESCRNPLSIYNPNQLCAACSKGNINVNTLRPNGS